jgi:ribonuclease Y
MSLTLSIPAIAIGFLVGFFLRRYLASKTIAEAETRANQSVADARTKAQDILLDANAKALSVLEDSKREEADRRKQLDRIENLLSKKEADLEERSRELTGERAHLKQAHEDAIALRTELDSIRQKQIAQLEQLSGIPQAQAKELLLNKMKEEYKEDLYHQLRRMDGENREELEKKAREIMTLAIQRYAGSHISDATTTVITLPSEDLKGKIIGKEGRNIKTLERLTGVDVVIDDTPGAMIISGFDPVRRQIAKMALEKLIADGRIHPTKIEEMVEKARTDINEKIRQAGEAALIECGVGMMDPKLVYLLGRLAFRTSFGQNVLLHSIEMAHVAGMLASELGADVMVSKKGALLHDIGKAVDHEVQGTHVEIGRKILAKFGVDDAVIKAMEAHHEEYPYSTLESRIVQAADAISGARPGARRDSVDIYLKRLEDLERIANSFDGVEKTYAIQAGREVRVFVTPNKIDDMAALQLARDIAKKIESEMKYPGEIRVNVIRETRAIEFAR